VREGENVSVASELESAFLLLHQPEIMISIKRLSAIDIDKEYFCFHKGFGLQYTVVKNGLIHNLIYPHVLPSIGAWIRNDLFEGIKFEGEELEYLNINFSMEETVVLYTVMNILEDRVKIKNEKLTVEEAIITFEDLTNYDKYAEIEGFIKLYMNKEEMEMYIKNNPNVKSSISSLVLKNILEFSDNNISFTIKAKNIFDPGKYIDSIVVTEQTLETNKVVSINIKTNGYIVITSNMSNEKAINYKFEVFPYSIDIADLMKIVCPITFEEKFGNEELFNKRIEEQKEKNK
jgi:hypothetical protein